MNSYEKAREILEENLDILHKLAELLLEKETVMGKEMDELIISMRPGIELPQYEDDELEKENPEPEKKEKAQSPDQGPESAGDKQQSSDKDGSGKSRR